MRHKGHSLEKIKKGNVHIYILGFFTRRKTETIIIAMDLLITSLSHVTNKSWIDYSTPDGFAFDQDNLFFAPNGRGKSSLAAILFNEAKKISDESALKYYDRDYAIKLYEGEDDSKINGVFANFGPKSIKAEQEIRELRESIVDPSSKQTIVQEKTQAVVGRFEAIFSLFKKDRRMNHTPYAGDLELFLKQFDSKLDEAKKHYSMDEIKAISSEDDFDSKIALVEKLPDLSIDPLSAEEYTDIVSICERKDSSSEIPSKRVVDWIKQGVTTHKEEQCNDRCLFCGGKMSLKDIEESLESYLRNRTQIDRETLNTAYQHLCGIHESIQSFCDNARQDYEQTLKKDEVGPLFDSLSHQCSLIEAGCKSITAKMESMESAIQFDAAGLSDCINGISGILTKLHDLKRFAIDSLEAKQNKINDLLKANVALAVQNDRSISADLKQISALRQEINKAEHNNAVIQQRIKYLERQESAVGDFANYVNSILSDLEIPLKLEATPENKYLLKSTKDVSLRIKDISEGERNMLGFLFFYYELFEDRNQSRMKSEYRCLIIDDPICSLDTNNRIFLLTLLRNLYEYDVQLFLFTHDYDDYSNLCYGTFAKEGHFKYLEIYKKTDLTSTMRTINPKTTPYRHDFMEIYRASKKNEGELDENDVYHLPNCMRRVLETYVFNRIGETNVTSRNAQRIGELLTPPNQPLSNKAKTSFIALLNLCNIGSHRTAPQKTEVLSSVKFLIKRFESADRLHYVAMTKPIADEG